MHQLSYNSNDLFLNAQDKNGQQMGAIAIVYSAGDVFNCLSTKCIIDYKCPI